jgi:DNA helicase-2/ATP-dependent DNA helicase PcrA
MEDGIFPGMQTITAGNAEMEEERRLAYVAITRAKRELLILHARTRLLYGSTTYNPISRFVSEIPSALIEEDTTNAPKQTYTPAAPAYTQRRASGGVGDPITVGKPLYGAKTPGGAAASAATGTGFAAGDRVRHPFFGEGVILSTKSMASDTLLEVAFDRVGTKKLMATYAKLKKI